MEVPVRFHPLEHRRPVEAGGPVASGLESGLRLEEAHHEVRLGRNRQRRVGVEHGAEHRGAGAHEAEHECELVSCSTLRHLLIPRGEGSQDSGGSQRA